MRNPLRLTTLAVVLGVVTLAPFARLEAQSSSSRMTNNSSYVVIDPLAGVTYDNKYDLSVSLGYRAAKAGPDLLDTAALGGIDVDGTYWLKKRLGLEATVRGYLGTSEAAPNTLGLKGQFIQNYIFAAGPQFLGPHNKHVSMSFHAMGGGLYGVYEGDLHGNPPTLINFYNNQFAPAILLGTHIDLNRSAHWALRISPGTVMTWMHQTGPGVDRSKMDINFGISAGVLYRFSGKR